MHAQVLLAKHGDMEAQLSPLSEIVSPDVTASIGMPRAAPACHCKKTCKNVTMASCHELRRVGIALRGF